MKKKKPIRMSQIKKFHKTDPLKAGSLIKTAISKFQKIKNKLKRPLNF